MAFLMTIVALVGYAISVMAYLEAPTITQEIAAILIFTNATLFLVGACIVGKLGEASPRPADVSKSQPQPEIPGTGTSARVNDYADWAAKLTKSKS